MMQRIKEIIMDESEIRTAIHNFIMSHQNDDEELSIKEILIPVDGGTSVEKLTSLRVVLD